jgi:uncharacterized protein
MNALPFWKTKSLADMTNDEWESLCDGCAQCCVVKLRDEDTGALGYTSVVCHLLDRQRCRCTQYAERHVRVPDCISINAQNVRDLDWLPETCAYRLLANGQDLEWWHPLVSGDRKSVHRAGISVRGRTVSEADVHPEDLELMVVRWIEKGSR